LKIYWSIDVRHDGVWKTLEKGEGESRQYGYSWQQVADMVFMHSSVSPNNPEWSYPNSRTCIWPAAVPAAERSLGNLVYVTYGVEADARDQEEDLRPMLEQLKRWGAITEFGYYPEGGGDTWHFDYHGVSDTGQGREVFAIVQAYESGWLHARSLADPDVLHPEEAAKIKDLLGTSNYNTALTRIRVAGGERAARLEARLKQMRDEAQARLKGGERHDLARAQQEHEEFTEFVLALAAEMDAGSEG
jgi:hypothetical protein